MKKNIYIKRIYEKASDEDGTRILVDRLWPRGVSKSKAHLTFWMKDIAPSTQLRKWFSHDSEKWPEFRKKYLKELEKKGFLFEELEKIARKNKKITLLYGAKDTEHNEARVIQEKLKNI